MMRRFLQSVVLASSVVAVPLLAGADVVDSQAAADPLERVIQGMRSAQEQIAKKETGKPTQEVQQQVVRDLERLIEMAQQSPPPQQNSSSAPQSPSPESQSQEQPQQSQRPEPQPQASQAPMPMPEQDPQETEQGPGGQEKAEVEESEQRQDPAEQWKAELARREAMIKDVWGHLPPTVRQKLLNVTGDKYLPKYEDLTRRYFENLAEQESRNDSRPPR